MSPRPCPWPWPRSRRIWYSPGVQRKAQAFVGLFVLSAATAATATPNDIPCRATELGSFEIDGAVDDWGRSHKSQPRGGDGGFSVACAYDAERLYLSVVVNDDRILRRSKVGEDTLSIELGESLGAPVQFSFLPATSAVESTLKGEGVKKGRLRHLEIMDSLQPEGWSVEMAIARAALPGWGPAVPGFSYRIRYRDVDPGGGGKTDAPQYGSLTFASARQVYDAFLKATRLKPMQIRFDQVANVANTPGAERVVAGGVMFGVLGEDFTFIKLPVTAPADVLGVQVTDAFGTGRLAIVTHYRQHGNGGSRDLVRVWRVLDNGSYESVMTIEVAKRLGNRAIVNRWDFQQRKDPPGQDLVVEAQPAQGFTAESFQETPAPDAVPILLPWAAEPKLFHRLTPEGYAGVADPPAPQSRRKR